MKAILVTIGDEILLGDTIDSNSAFIAQKLVEIGVKVTEILSVADTQERILNALSYGLSQADLIITTGGLGPTNDDLTKESLAEFFETDLVENEYLKQKVIDLYQRRNRSLADITPKMTHVPAAAELLPNDYGVAPGIWLNQGDKAVVALPGVPFEMRGIVQDHLITKIQNRFKLPKIKNHYFLTAGRGETVFAKRLEQIENHLPENITLSYLPSYKGVKIRLSSSDENLSDEFDLLVPKIREVLKPEMYSEDKNDSIPLALARLCIQKGVTIGSAESCTGGTIAKQITANAGSSAYFQGSVVAYANAVKMNILGVKSETLSTFGAVSEKVVQEMVQGAISALNVDYAVATSGIAGPSGGSEEKPVGMVCIAVGNQHQIKSHTFQFSNKRAKNIELATSYALTMLYRMILEH